MMISRLLIAMATTLSLCLFAQSIEEKKQALSQTPEITHQVSDNQSKLLDVQAQLEQVYENAQKLRVENAPLSAYEPLYEMAKKLHLQWQEMAKGLVHSSGARENEAIWHLPDATVKQLVIDFAGGDAIYLIPDEIGQRKVAVISSLSIPQQNWTSMLELILSQMGIGVRRVNAFCKELFVSGVGEGFDFITDRREELYLVPDEQRLCFVMGSGPVDIKQFARALSRLVDPSTTQVKPIGSQLALIAPALRLRQLLQIYDFMARTEQTKAYRIVSLSRLSAEDLQKMLGVIFAQVADPSAAGKGDLDAIGLQVFPIQYDQRAALFVAGSEMEVKRAVNLISELESQIEASSGKKLFWYSAKHANPEDLAKVVAKVYKLLVQTSDAISPSSSSLPAGSNTASNTQDNSETSKDSAAIPGNIPPLVISPDPVGGKAFDKSIIGVDGEGQIVVDAKSGALIMVLEPAVVHKVKELLARLDTPKKMVRIDFLLFEKKIIDNTQFGLEQLKLGASATGVTQTGFGYTAGALTDSGPAFTTNGIIQFFSSYKGKHGIPSFDVGYNFLLSQESISINANPSVITLNGTPTTVNLVDEISINTGPTQWPSQQGGNPILQNSYVRAQYGIMLKVTPTVHQSDEAGQSRSITLETDINFDTPSSITSGQPLVTRRNIKNLVKVLDGQTIVLGGLRQKQTDDTQTSMPFLGDIPGFGKLFSYAQTSDVTKEMFIFITPHIIDDSQDDYQKLQIIEMRSRPGDINEFLVAYEESGEQRQRGVFARSLQTIFGRPQPVKINESSPRQRGEYDGRN